MTAPRPEAELKACPFCGSADTMKRIGKGFRFNRRRCNTCKAVGPLSMYDDPDALWNTRPADAVRVKGERFLHAVESYHDAIKLRDDVENSHMWSRELRVMYDAMVGFRAALAQDGKEHP